MARCTQTHTKLKAVAALLLLCLYAAPSMALPTITQVLSTDWKLRNTKEDSWTDVNVPNNIMYTLFVNKKIPHPYYANNEKLVQWVDTCEWQYGVFFDIDAELYKQKNIDLVFEGLDTYCEIMLNGVVLKNTDNAFRTWRVPIKSILVLPQRNYLVLTFKSIGKTADSLANLSVLKLPTDSRAYVRRPHFNFGWDFAPKLLSSGISGIVKLQGYEVPDGQIIPLYSAQPMASLDMRKFQFSINGEPLFIKGVNMVPPRTFEPITTGVIDQLLKRCDQLGINMIRVWGGGNYMPEYFYEQCTKRRIMVWQDLMFANALIPPYEWMRKSVLAEVEDNVRRLMKHECIVLWCGNNEISEGWENWGWRKQYKQTDSVTLIGSYKQLFEKEIPNLIAKYDKMRPYIPSSPKFGWGDKLSLSNADCHYWGVWWGKEDISAYYTHVPRFMSEFGMQALPSDHSISQMCDKRDINSDSLNFTSHQKHPTGFDNLRHYLARYPQHFDNLGYVYFTNLLQRDALVTAVSAQRSAYPYCNGTMLWQLNDCWPGITWSIVDFYNQPKAAFYELKNAFGKDYLTLAKQVYENDKNIIDNKVHEFAFTLCDATINPMDASIKTNLSVYEFGGELVYKTSDIKWQKNSGGVYYSTSFFDKESFAGFNWNMQYAILEIQQYSKPFIRKPFFFSEPRDLLLPQAKCDIKWLSDTSIWVTANDLAKDVFLRSSNSETEFSTNYFNLLPNEGKEVKVYSYRHNKDTIRAFSSVDFAY
ncbi:MAG: Exo-beta-D-glucosaminidase [Bacteroidota bacterium]|jgi:beta-mannosidase